MTAIVGAGDFDGDGHPDVLARSTNGTLWLYPQETARADSSPHARSDPAGTS